MFNWLKKAFAAPGKTQRATTLGPAVDGTHSDASIESASCKSRGDQCLAEGRFEDAVGCYRQAVSFNPGNVDALFSLGVVFFQQNSFDDAVRYLREAVSVNPAMAQAFYFLGSSLQKLGRFDEAVGSFSKALELKPDAEIIYGDLCYTFFQMGQYEAAKAMALRGLSVNPNFPDFHLFLGNIYVHEEDFDRAIECYRKVLAIQPDSVTAYANLRRLLLGLGNPEKSIACYLSILASNPGNANAHYDLAEAYQKTRAFDKAMECYREAITLRPDFVEAYNNLGSIFFNDQGKPAEAVACYQKALAIKPDSAEIHYNLGIVCKAYGKFDEATAHYNRALELNPDFAGAYCNLGEVFMEQGKLDEALTCFHKALALNPAYADALYGVAATLMAQRKSQEAVAYFRKTLEVESNHFTARTLLLYALQHRCEWENLDVHVEAIRRAVLESPATGKNMFPPFAFLALPGTTAREQKYCAARWARHEFRSLASLRSKLGFTFNRAPGERISIGYISADFRQHPVSFLMTEVFELHDRSRFHVTAYSYGPDDGSAMRKRLEKAFDSFVDIREDTYEDAARRIYSDRIDILVDLTGHTQDTRSGILALRPAPVQVNYLGYPGTMGADFVDYMIADRFTIPPEMRQFYTEKVVWMPDCFQANDSTRPRLKAPSRDDCGLPEGAVVFCCFNQTFKITPEFFGIWCRLLQAVPGSVLWLPASNPHVEANLRREAAARGGVAERLVMAPLMHRDEHLARLQCADLFLDTLPFNAGTTCSDALWMGLPVVTCAGDAFASRMAGSLLTALGVPELVTYNLDDYYRLALGLATDRGRLDAVRARIVANRDSAPLFDSGRFVRNLEGAYVDMMAVCPEKSITGY